MKKIQKRQTFYLSFFSKVVTGFIFFLVYSFALEQSVKDEIFTKETVEDAAPIKTNKTIKISLDADSPGYTISPYLFGCNLYYIGFTNNEYFNKANPGHDYVNNPAHDQLAVKYMKESGVTFFRIWLQNLFDIYSFGGSDNKAGDPICPSEGAQCNFTRADEFIEALNGLGIEISLMVSLYCPEWLSTKRDRPDGKGDKFWNNHRSPPKDNQKWAQIIAGLVKHYNYEKKFDIKNWEIGNEPDGERTEYWINGSFDEFVEYFKVVAKTLRSVYPAIQLSGPTTAGTDHMTYKGSGKNWLESFLNECGTYLDICSFNKYSTGDISTKIIQVKSYLQNNHLEKMPIYIPEHNILTNSKEPQTNFFNTVSIVKRYKCYMENGILRAAFFGWDAKIHGMLDLQTYEARPAYHCFRMFAALGNFKNGRVISNYCANTNITVASCSHQDNMGFSVVIGSEEDTDTMKVELFFKNQNGNYELTSYQYTPQNNIKKLKVQMINLNDLIRLSFPGKSISLFIFRKK
ncbi:MAG: hypothetical protein A2096_12880 [Spirochaetes bacterium GWF1_41_5]|nr:MAG: hypothetical protein A2096_12880 [Spirochaetes bacterium GWF1_41_5]HBE04761.1 hypothetical protein [Spirochaetia bacterium]